MNGQDHIQLNHLLKLKDLVSSGGEANMMIVEGYVIVNKVVESRKRMKLRAGDVVTFNEVVIKIVS